MKFSEWLDANPNISKVAMAELGVKRAAFSHVRTGRRPMPKRWIPIIVRLSRKRLTFESLLREALATPRTSDQPKGKPK